MDVVKKAYDFGMEVEFDAPSWLEEEDEIRNGDRRFYRIGRDGAGQGELRSLPSDSLLECASSIIKSYQDVQQLVKAQKKEGKKLSNFWKKMKHLKISSIQFESEADDFTAESPDDVMDCLSGEDEEESPNGLHITTSHDDEYTKRMFQTVAVWWNQHTLAMRDMLDLRREDDYGYLDDIRPKTINGKEFSEYRFFNAPTKDKHLTRFKKLVKILDYALKTRPPLPKDLQADYDEDKRKANEWVAQISKQIS